MTSSLTVFLLLYDVKKKKKKKKNPMLPWVSSVIDYRKL